MLSGHSAACRVSARPRGSAEIGTELRWLPGSASGPCRLFRQGHRGCARPPSAPGAGHPQVGVGWIRGDRRKRSPRSRSGATRPERPGPAPPPTGPTPRPRPRLPEPPLSRARAGRAQVPAAPEPRRAASALSWQPRGARGRGRGRGRALRRRRSESPRGAPSGHPVKASLHRSAPTHPFCPRSCARVCLRVHTCVCGTAKQSVRLGSCFQKFL